MRQEERHFVPFFPAFSSGKSGTTFVLVAWQIKPKHETKADANFR
jgi:hypothetical protein